MEAVKQGSATVGVKSKTHAVLVALKRAQNELSAHQQKCLRIAPHCGMSMAGLTADGRGLTNFMRTEALNYEMVYGSDMPVARLVDVVGSKLQTPTQIYYRRPFGVGLLIAGYDKQGPHIYQTCPSANYYSCKAMSIGSRSQSARTYLEKYLDELEGCSKNDLVKHGLMALRETLPTDQVASIRFRFFDLRIKELTEHNVTVCIVGENQKYAEYNNEETKQFLDLLDSTKKPARERAQADDAAPAEEPAAEEPAAMEE